VCPLDYRFTIKIDKIALNQGDPYNFESKYHIGWYNASQFLAGSIPPTSRRLEDEKKPIEKPTGF
jgi:hypothetical protein